MIPARHEFCINLSPRPGCAWLLALLAFLALPKLAATADTSAIVMTNYYSSPSGVYDTLTVTGQTHLADRGGEIQLLPTGSMTNRVGVGTMSPEMTFHVAGNLQVTGCIHLGKTKKNEPINKRCKWY